MKVTFGDGQVLGEGGTVWSWQSPDNFMQLVGPSLEISRPESLPLAASLQVEGVTLVNLEAVQSVLAHYDTGDRWRVATARDIAAIARAVGLTAPQLVESAVMVVPRFAP